LTPRCGCDLCSAAIISRAATAELDLVSFSCRFELPPADLYISRRLKTVLRRQLLQSFFFFSAHHYRSQFHRSRSSVAVGEDKTRAAARVTEPSRFPASCIRECLLVSQCGLPHLSGSRENRPAWSR